MRQAARQSTLLCLAILVVVLAGVMLPFLGEAETASVPSIAASPDAFGLPAAQRTADDRGGPEPAVIPEPGGEVARLTLGRGGTLAASLDRLSISGRVRGRLLEAAAAALDLRRLSDRTGLAAVTDREGRLTSLAVRAAPDRYLRLSIDTRNDESPVGESVWVDLPVVATGRIEQGVVEQSVAQALGDAPHGRLLTVAFADIFQWDVDLLVEPRPGDQVRLVYEARRLGRVPGDLPPFGDVVEREGDEMTPGRILAASYSGRIAAATAYWVESDDGAGSYYDAQGRPLRKTFLKSPLNYRRISSGFSNARRHPISRRVVPHHGVDFAAAPGTPVVATADGRIASAGWDGPLGRAVKVRHGSEYITVYGHLRGFARGVRAGAQVKQNQVIGYVGSSGRATGPHLHYTMLRSGSAINPLRFENPPSEPLPLALRPRLESAMQRWASRLVDVEGDVEVAGSTGHAPSRGGPGPGA